MGKLGYLAAFALGAGAGILAARRFFKDLYEEIAQEEIDSVKAAFARRREEEKKEETEKPQAKPDIMSYMKRMREAGYSAPADETVQKDAPYTIPPDEFGELEGYEALSLILYADGVLADEDGEPVDDAADIIGDGALNRFGEYEEDAVYVRNDARKCDYEVLRDERDYEDGRT